MPDLTLTTLDGTWVNNPDGNTDQLLDAGELRLAASALVASGGIGRGLAVSVTSADQVTVAPGAAVIDGGMVAAGTGVYQVGLPAPVSAVLEARDATNARIDRVVIRQYDPDVVGGHILRKAAIEVLTGLPAAVPAPPALPQLAVDLGLITVPPSGGGKATIDGSVRLAVRPTALPERGIETFTFDDDSTLSREVTFSQPFDEPPIIIAGVQSNFVSVPFTAQASNVTTTGFTIRIFDAGQNQRTGTHSATWVAYPAR